MSVDLVDRVQAELETRRAAIERLAETSGGEPFVLEVNVHPLTQSVSIRWHPKSETLRETDAA